jgi:hypothetical protein
MLEQKVQFISENLARSMNRRRFVKQAGTTVFGALAAMAAGHMVIGRASAQGPQPPTQQPNCAPPGPYCNTGGGILSGCHGSSCFQHLYNAQVLQCRVYYAYYQAGCWTSSGTGGYWTCCDCECGTPVVAHCGCAQFSGGPLPRPDGPTVGKADS